MSLNGRQRFKNEHEWHSVFFKRDDGRAKAQVLAGRERSQSRQTRRGDISFAPANTSFEGWTDGYEEYNYLAWFSSPMPIIYDLVEAGQLPQSSVRSGNLVFDGSPCFHNLRISYLLEQISREIQSGHFGASLFLEFTSAQLHLELLRNFSSYRNLQPDGTAPVKKHRMDKLTDFMRGNLEKDLHLTDLAAMAGLSLYHFSRVFKSEVGVSPHVYLSKVRVERASELLRTSNLPLKAIAGRAGFASASRLCEAFRKTYGMTPTVFRKLGAG